MSQTTNQTIKFEIKEEFYINDEVFKMMSGAFHYFRVHEEEWNHTFHNVKALGLNTVETYIPWNMIEPLEGQFNQEHIDLLARFIEKVAEHDLYLIFRPSPYICSEWELGGLPAWLLNDPSMTLRSSDEFFLEKVENYYREFLPQMAKYQFTHGGPILMMQVENEYGSYAHDKEYLKSVMNLMKKYGVDVPLFTSDGTWLAALESGSLIEEDVLVTGNFGSRTNQSLDDLEAFFEKHDKKWPVMSMEFWDGWFNRWGMEIVTREAEELADEVEAMALRGSFNLYMFHGGTNFGFMNGCSGRRTKDLPQITSYDYGALLNEEGNPTDKFFSVQKALKRAVPNIQQFEPKVKRRKKYETLTKMDSIALFDVVDEISTLVESDTTQTFENLDNPYGYVLYSTHMQNYSGEDKIKLIETSDRAHVYSNKKHLVTQYGEELGEEIFITDKDQFDLDVLVENLGRVNYGFKLQAPSQRKGIRRGIMHDMHFHKGINHYPLNLDKEMIEKLSFDGPKKHHSGPIFHRFELDLSNKEVESTFIDCSDFGKGAVLVNGFNLGRYWSIGPVGHLYIPKDLLNQGKNEFIVFETEEVAVDELSFSEDQILIEIK